MSNASSPPSAPRKGRGFGFYFWATIFTLLAVTLVAVAAAMIRSAGSESPAQPSASGSLIEQQLSGIISDAQRRSVAAVEREVDPHLDRIFGPVYAAIPAYADFHYTVWGQYAELGAAVLEDRVGSTMRQHMFDGFEDRHQAEIAALHQVYLTELSDAFAAESQARTGSARLNRASQQILEDAKQRMMITAPAGAVSSVAVGSIVAPIAGKIIASTAAKAAAKGVGKAAGIGGGMAAGAAGGSFLGPVGTVAGGVGGGLATWLLVDYAVVKLDEYFNRDEFEAELRAAIDVERQNMRREILASYAGPESPSPTAP